VGYFDTTITLENGVPIDWVSKMLGHRSIKTTQIYVKVSNKKISEDTEKLFKRIRVKIGNQAFHGCKK
jgi:site-specific recombinase XerD